MEKDVTAHVERVIAESPDFFTLDSLGDIVSALGDMDKATKDRFWDLLKVYVPRAIRDGDLDDMLANRLLPQILLSGMDMFVLNKRDTMIPESFPTVLMSLEDFLRTFPGVPNRY